MLQYLAYISWYKILDDLGEYALQMLFLTAPVVHKHHAEDVLVSLLHWNGLSQLVPFSHKERLKDKCHIKYVISAYLILNSYA